MGILNPSLILFTLVVSCATSFAAQRELNWDEPECKKNLDAPDFNGRHITQVCTTKTVESETITSDEKVRAIRFYFSDGTSKSYYLDSRSENQEKNQSCGHSLYFESAQIRDDPENSKFRKGILFWIGRNYGLTSPRQNFRFVGQAPSGETFSFKNDDDDEANRLTLDQILTEKPGCGRTAGPFTIYESP